MANVTLRLVKGVPLTNAEVDNNFSNLNIFKTEIGGDLGGNVLYPTVIGIQGRSVSSDAPGNTQVLVWSDTANAWIPGNAASSYDDLQTKPGVNVIITGDVLGSSNVVLLNTDTNIVSIDASYDFNNLDSRFLKLSNPTTQIVTSYIDFQGNVTFSGNVTTLSANNLVIEDNFIYLNNGTQNTNVDFGFVGNYNDGTYAHAGFFRDASDNGTWKIFDGYLPEPDEAINIDTDNASFRLANLQVQVLKTNTITGITDTSVVTNLNADLLDGQQGTYYVDYVNTTNPPAANVSLTGDVTGSANVVLVSGTNDITITTTIQPNSVALGTDTTGNYTDRVVAGNGIIATGTADEGNVITVGLTNTGVTATTYGNATIVPIITIDDQGRITSASNVTIAGGGAAAVLDAQKNFTVVDACALTATGCHNIFIGQNAGRCTTFGSYNFFAGLCAGFSNTTSCNNIFLGREAGVCNTSGCLNTFLGFCAGRSNTSGFNNTFLGFCAGASNTSGCYNTFLGFCAGRSNTTGRNNTFIGYSAGRVNNIGCLNTFVGYLAGFNNTSGFYNTFVGYQAGRQNNTGSCNTFLGFYTGCANTTGTRNIFLGFGAGCSNSTGCRNTFLGHTAGNSNTTGSRNIFLGFYTGRNNTTGACNTFIGYYAGFSNGIGTKNTFLGFYAGYSNSTGCCNIFLGLNSGCDITTGVNNTIIGSVAGTSSLANTIILATGTCERIRTDGELGNTTITGNVIASAFFGDGSKLTGIFAGSQVSYIGNVFIATASQTLFNVSYSVGLVEVFKNGAKLIVDSDFYANTGSNITLSSPAIVDDVIEIISFQSFNIADTYTKGEADNLFFEAASFTGNNILTELVTVDGSNSGLDADTVDGIHIQVVSSLPGSPDPNTFYIVTG